MAGELDAIERVAKALYARRNGPVGEDPLVAEYVWSALDESERTQYRLDAVAAIRATKPETKA